MLVKMKDVCAAVKLDRHYIQDFEEAGLVSHTSTNKYGHFLFDEAAVRAACEAAFYVKMGFRVCEIRDILNLDGAERCEILKEKMKLMEAQIHEAGELLSTAQKVILNGGNYYD